MKISLELQKEFQNVSIKITEPQKSDIFFRQSNPYVLINLAKYQMSNNVSSITLKLLKETYAKDLRLRKSLFEIIQLIEEKITGYLIQHIIEDHPDFHLQSKNFKLLIDKENRFGHFKTVNKFISDLRKHHDIQIQRQSTIPKKGYITFDKFISNLSLGMKAKIIKYSLPKFKTKILTGFAMDQNVEQINFAISFFINLNILRNRVMHHNSVIDYKWKSEYGSFNIFEFIKISTHFFKSIEMIEKLKKEFAELSSIKKMTKADLQKILGPNDKK